MSLVITTIGLLCVLVVVVVVRVLLCSARVIMAVVMLLIVVFVFDLIFEKVNARHKHPSIKYLTPLRVLWIWNTCTFNVKWPP